MDKNKAVNEIQRHLEKFISKYDNLNLKITSSSVISSESDLFDQIGTDGKVLSVYSIIASQILRGYPEFQMFYDENGWWTINRLSKCVSLIFQDMTDCNFKKTIAQTAQFANEILSYALTKSLPAKTGMNVGRGGRYHVKFDGDIIMVKAAYGHFFYSDIRAYQLYNITTYLKPEDTLIHGTLYSNVIPILEDGIMSMEGLIVQVEKKRGEPIDYETYVDEEAENGLKDPITVAGRKAKEEIAEIALIETASVKELRDAGCVIYDANPPAGIYLLDNPRVDVDENKGRLGVPPELISKIHKYNFNKQTKQRRFIETISKSKNA